MKNALNAIHLKTDHILRLTDETGILQHSVYGVPNRSMGYTADDNSRALILAVRMYDEYRQVDFLKLIYRYTAFLCHAQNSDGTFRNSMDYNRNFTEDRGSEDCMGRCLWALSYAYAHSITPQNIKSAAWEMIQSALPHCPSLVSPRAKAYAIVGLSVLHDESSRRYLEGLTLSLADQYDEYRDGDWHWFEDYLTYSNAVLPWAMLSAAKALRQDRFEQIGYESLHFLQTQTFNHTYFKPIGCKGWLNKGETPELFDQQPLEACETTLALLEAYRINRKPEYLDRAHICYSWYHGNNVKNLSLVDSETGGCFDGITPEGVNFNQGAESIISLWMAYLAIKQYVR